MILVFILKLKEIDTMSEVADHIKIFLTGGIAHKNEGFDESQMSDEEIRAAVEVAQRATAWHRESPPPANVASALDGTTSSEDQFR